MAELLAPAGSMDALRAAVESGADAVYLSGNYFGARAYADNFDESAMREAIRFAHLRGVNVHVTVNTIVSDDEMPELAEYARFLYAAGADAVLVQDMGVAKVIMEAAPGLPLHASTQMTVHNLAGVLELQRMGFSRVVLSRELSLEDIRYICKNSSIEIEVFMHGALCICYSGQCLMSSMIGGRSGNRGRCAQPCRLPYSLVDEHGDDLSQSAGKYLLSPKDMNTIEILPELLEAGVTSLKIEGRMKRPEYVATVVGVYRKAIDSYEKSGVYSIPRGGQNQLRQIFNRDFTTAYLEGRPGRNMMSDRRPNNRGVLIGRVVSYDDKNGRVTAKLSAPVSNGDQVDFWVKVGGRVAVTVSKLRNSEGRDIDSAEQGEVSFAVTGRVHPHDRIFKVYDASLMEMARAKFKSGSPIRRKQIDVWVYVAIGSPMIVKMSDEDGNTARAETNFVGEVAQKHPLDENGVRKQFSRMGSTIYEIRSLKCDINGNVMIPMSEINEVRRRAASQLDDMRLSHYERAPLPGYTYIPQQRRVAQLCDPMLLVSVDNIADAETAIEAGASGIIFGGDSYSHRKLKTADYAKAADVARKYGRFVAFNTPRILNERFMNEFRTLMKSFCDISPDEVYLHNIGMMSVAKELGLPMHTDYSFIAFNAETLSLMQRYGVVSATASPELTLSQISGLSARCPIELECIIAGRLELMVSEYCAVGSFIGGAGENGCSMPCVRSGHRFFLHDRKEMDFPLVMDQYCHMHVLNSKSLSMLPYMKELRETGVKRFRIEARGMGADRIKELVRTYRQALDHHSDFLPEEMKRLKDIEGRDVTRGHYFHDVQ